MTLHGAISAIVTPFTADAATVDERALRDLVDRTVAAGADGIIACGGTGEFIALSTEERREVVRIVTEQAGGRIPVIAQTGGLSTREAIAHGEDAASVGADALMALDHADRAGRLRPGDVCALIAIGQGAYFQALVVSVEES